MSFETNGLRFLVRNRADFCLVCILPQKQRGVLTRHHHSTTARYGLRNDHGRRRGGAGEGHAPLDFRTLSLKSTKI